MSELNKYLPAIDIEELTALQPIVSGLDDDKLRSFASSYSASRRDPNLILITTIVGFFGVAGIQRFLTNDIGMGILYFFTAGLCLIGTIIDLVNYKKLAIAYNVGEAQKVVGYLRSGA